MGSAPPDGHKTGTVWSSREASLLRTEASAPSECSVCRSQQKTCLFCPCRHDHNEELAVLPAVSVTANIWMIPAQPKTHRILFYFVCSIWFHLTHPLLEWTCTRARHIEPHKTSSFSVPLELVEQNCAKVTNEISLWSPTHLCGGPLTWRVKPEPSTGFFQ